MSTDTMVTFDQLPSLDMDEFDSLDLDNLKKHEKDELEQFMKIINELNLDDLSSIQMWTLSRLVHFISTMEISKEFYERHFIHPQGNIRVMINEPSEKIDRALFRGSQNAYDYPIGKQIDLGNRPYSEDLSVAQTFGTKTVFHVYGEYYRINFKNDSMYKDELESRIKRGTTGVVRGKGMYAKGVQHYLVIIEQHPDDQNYNDNVTGTAKTAA